MQSFVQMIIKLKIEYRLFHVDFKIMELAINSSILKFNVMPHKDFNVLSVIMCLNIHELLISQGFLDAAVVSP